MYNLIIILPLIGAILSWIFGNRFSSIPAYIASISCLCLSMVISWIAFYDIAILKNDFAGISFSWINSGDFIALWAFNFDTLSCVMFLVVNTVSAMVHLYSVGYMSHDKSKARFMAYLSFFTFAMLMLVSSNNLLQLFFGWEGVGVASYLLIGFWYNKKSATSAAIKAFLVNRVGDLGFILGLIFIFTYFDTIMFEKIFELSPSMMDTKINFLGFSVNVIEMSCFLLFIGAMGKSAQLFLHTWLPDAMEGPTPVSALIHAATMVTAGVFMVCKLSPLFEYAPNVLSFITLIGALTALFASTIALTQFDIKRVIAYSTCSQLGYMFFAVGLSAYPAAMFHLTTHAFFKALLFLGAGSVIHGLSNEQDMRKMGGCFKKLPVTYILIWIGSLALAGIPFFAGYYSKDMILEVAFASDSTVGYFAFVCGCIAAVLTAFYSWRLLYLTFHGEYNGSQETYAKIHESPIVMLIPLFVLAFGAVFSGWFFMEMFVGNNWDYFWANSIFILSGNDAIIDAHDVPKWVKLFPIVLAVIGISIATIFYVLIPELPGRMVQSFKFLHNLFFNKWYFDEIYNFVFVKPIKRFSIYCWNIIDKKFIDGIGPNGVSSRIFILSKLSSKIHTGYVYHYSFSMFIGLAILAIILIYNVQIN
ncbi:MAG: NADH-quinone oxidoreductase subunit L [SAR116 cluster bacterium]|nr:NADH-quinone oxidoreductase subunit L [SAR116 cluster bacterium]RPH08485.1 MAG: NADH-quinone oxidoreductase subunit L [Alphaproteobacteria bacterium TMED54]